MLDLDPVDALAEVATIGPATGQNARPHAERAIDGRQHQVLQRCQRLLVFVTGGHGRCLSRQQDAAKLGSAPVSGSIPFATFHRRGGISISGAMYAKMYPKMYAKDWSIGAYQLDAVVEK